MQDLLRDLNAIALAAGRTMMEIYGRDFEVTQKEDKSPVTEADRAAEAVILPGLAKAAPHIPIISEEAFSEGHRPEIGNEFFLVDPLDGTKEFINRNGEFTVNIALIRDQIPVAGVVYAPAKERLFCGGDVGSAQEWTVTNFESTNPRPISVRDPQGSGLIAVASRSHRDAKTDEYLEQFNISEVVSAGSSLKFCLVAAGEADIYPRHGRTMEWDTAAGHAVLRAAGGTVTQFDNSPFLYGKFNEGFANPFFVAKGQVS